MAGREERSPFVAALEAEIDLMIDIEETTAVTPPAMLEALTVEATPPPAELPRPLGAEARAFADRVRFVLGYQEGMAPDRIEDVIRRARNLMPRNTSASRG